MNQQVSSPELNIVPGPPGSVEDQIMADSPAASTHEQIQNADKDLADKVGKVVESSPEENSEQGDNSEAPASAPEGKGYEPAKEFLDFIQSQTQDNYQQPSTQQQRAESPKEPQTQTVTDDGAVPDDAVKQQMDAMQGMIQDLTNTIHGDRQRAIDRGTFESVNDVYVDVTKDVPDEARNLVNVWNNAVLGYHDLSKIDQGLIEGSTKAMTSELDSYFNARVANEGYVKSGQVPPSVNSNLGEITPPPSKGKDYGDSTNRPTSAFDEVDKDFARKVNNLFTQ